MIGSGGFDVGTDKKNILNLPLFRKNILIALTKFKNKAMHQNIAQFLQITTMKKSLCSID